MPSNRELARKGYELFLKGDIQSLIADLLDEDCQWVIPGPKDKMACAGAYSGKAQIGNFFELLSERVEFTKFETRQMIDGWDTIAITGSSAGRTKSAEPRIKSPSTTIDGRLRKW